MRHKATVKFAASGGRPQQQQLVKEEEEAEERGIPLHMAKCSQTGGGGGETTWPQRPSVRPTIQQVWQSLWLPANQPSNRASEWFGLVALVRLPPAWLLTRFARLNANGRNSVHSPIDFPPIHFTHRQKSRCDVPSSGSLIELGQIAATCSPSSR